MKMKEIHRSFTLSSQNGANFAGEKTKTRSLKEINSIYYITMSYLRFTKMFLLILACVMGGLSANAQTLVEDVIVPSGLIGTGGTGYQDYEFKDKSEAVYALHCIKNKDNIQLNNKNLKEGVVTKNSGGTARKVTVVWASGTSNSRKLEIYGSNTPYSNTSQLYDEKTAGDPLGVIEIGKSTTLDITGDYKYIAMKSSNKAMYLTSITITWEGSGAPGEITVANPVLSEQSQTITSPIDVTITTATPDAKIYYTVDGTTPSTTNGTLYSTPVQVDKSLTLKAIAVLGDKTSDVVEATYTLFETTNNGSFEKPYTPAEFIVLNPTENVWVKGVILGNAKGDGEGFDTTDPKNTNVCIGEAGLDKNIPVAMVKNDHNLVRDLNLHTLTGKKLMVYGKAAEYFSRTGIKTPQFFFIDGNDALAKMEVATAEGYSTFYNTYAVQVPAGVQCGIVTGVENGVMTIDYKYTEGMYIPANTPVIVKAEGIKTYPLAISTSDAQAPTTNLLKGATEDGKFTAETNYYYYKLAYDDFNNKTDLGFYWGEANGGAFKMKAGKAYLAVEKTVAQGAQKFSLEGNATGIEAVEQANEANRVVYTLDGRRVMNEKLAKGLYIINGKKVLVK